MLSDAQGHPITGATAEAAAAYDEGARCFVLVHGDAIGCFDAAIQASPDCVMAHLAKGWALLLANDPAALTVSRGLVEKARQLSRNVREEAHLKALSQAVDGARAAAVAILDRHLMGAPFDLIAHQSAMMLDVYLGRIPLVRGRSARAMPFWSRGQPGYGCILAYHGFGLEEAGDYTRAEDESREAAQLEPLCFWPHHTVSHVMEETGRPEDGLRWMAEREPLWANPRHQFQVHIW